MRVLRYVLTIAVILAAKTVSADVRHTIGIARDTNDQSLRYIEHHQYLDSGTHLVRYFTSDLELMVSKGIHYPGLPQHPEIVQRDYVNDINITFAQLDRVGTMTRQAASENREFSFRLQDNIIIDAGFDAFIRANWDSLVNGADEKFKLAVAGQPRLLSVRISPEPLTAESATFIVKPTNWLIRLLVPEVRLTYSPSRELLRYEGFSNLKPDPGQSRTVLIDFSHYALDSSLDEPLPEWLAGS